MKFNVEFPRQVMDFPIEGFLICPCEAYVLVDLLSLRSKEDKHFVFRENEEKKH